MEKKEQIYHQVDFDNIPKEVEMDYMDGDIAILDDLKEIPHFDTIKLNAILILICTEGKLQLNMNTNAHTVYPNDILLCLPNIILNNCMISPDFRGKVLCLSTRIIQQFLPLEKDIWNKIFHINQNPILHIGEEGAVLFKQYYSLISLKINQPRHAYYKNVMLSLIHASLYELLADMDKYVTSSAPDSTRQTDCLFRKFIELLSNSEVKKRSVSHYAEQLFVTPKYLSSVCKQVSGKTAFEWINDYVIEDITYLLKYSDKSIKEIYQYLDFPNISFFGKYVKAHLGVSPTEYRKMIQTKE